MSEGSSALLFMMVIYVVSFFVAGWLRRWCERRTTGFAEEYMSRFVFPIVDEARDHGITQEELNEMWAEAMKHADAYRPPGGIFRSLVERRIAQLSEESIFCPTCGGDGLDADGLGTCADCEGKGTKWWEWNSRGDES
jgi:hypothetical protein